MFSYATKTIYAHIYGKFDCFLFIIFFNFHSHHSENYDSYTDLSEWDNSRQILDMIKKFM
jgi:hypothetical protein